MDINRNTDVLPVPSGFEVESATFHMPVDSSHTLPPPEGIHGKIDDLRSRGMRALDTLKSRGNETLETLKERGSETLESLKARGNVMVVNAKQSLAERQTTVKDGVHVQVDRMNSSMRTNPAKWAGIAAGSGFVLGLLGRWMQHRHKHHPITELVIIDAAC